MTLDPGWSSTWECGSWNWALLFELFLEQLHSLDHCFWFQTTNSDWWDRAVLQTWVDQPWWQNFRMSKATFREICAELALELQWWNTYIRALLNVEKHVAFAIWKLTIPDCYRLASNQLGVGRSTIGAVVIEVCPAIRKVLSPWLISHGNARILLMDLHGWGSWIVMWPLMWPTCLFFAPHTRLRVHQQKEIFL